MRIFYKLQNINLVNPISFIAGIPFANKNMQIKATAAIDTQAAIKKIIFINNSLNFFHPVFVPTLFFSCISFPHIFLKPDLPINTLLARLNFTFYFFKF